MDLTKSVDRGKCWRFYDSQRMRSSTRRAEQYARLNISRLLSVQSIKCCRALLELQSLLLKLGMFGKTTFNPSSRKLPNPEELFLLSSEVFWLTYCSNIKGEIIL